MTERRKPPGRNLEKASMNPKEPMTKLQKQITKWLKDNVPTKKTKFLHSHVVDYFIGKKAVDLMMEESPWALHKGQEGFAFTSREECVELLDTLLRYKMFHRAKKIPVIDEKDKKGKKKDKSDSETEKDKLESDKVKPERKNSKREGEEERFKSEGEGEEERMKSEGDGEEHKPKKRRIRLDMHLDQIFLDCTDAYVWLYDPIPWYYWIAGGVICLGLIALCLFPLWPRKIRRGTHWVAWLASCFMVGVLCLGILKYILFAIFYGLSGMKFKFWIFPNLTEDTTFLGSFWPLYAYTYTGKVEREEEGETDRPLHEDSDSSETAKSGFVMVEKSKDD